MVLKKQVLTYASLAFSPFLLMLWASKEDFASISPSVVLCLLI
jgi:hypothetical protein